MNETMAGIAAIVFICLFVSYGVIAVIYLILLQRFFTFTKKSHPEVWDELGKPHLFMSNTPGNLVRLHKFLFKKKYLDRDSKELETRAVRIKKLLITSYAIFPIMIVLFFIVGLGA